MKFNKNLTILHLDGGAGLTVGLLLILLQDWAGNLYNLPDLIIVFLAAANVCYGVLLCALRFQVIKVLYLSLF